MTGILEKVINLRMMKILTTKINNSNKKAMLLDLPIKNLKNKIYQK